MGALNPTEETTSPELVLVDDALALRARDRLPSPDDTLARLEREISLRRLVARQLDDLEVAAPEAVDHVSPTVDRARRPIGRRPRLVAATTTAVALVVALLLGVQVDLRGTPAGAESVVEDTAEPVVEDTADPNPGAVEKTSPVETTSSVETTRARPSTTRGTRYRPADAGGRSSRPFAWAPVPGASAYRVEFFRGSDRIYSSETARPQLELPRKWKFGGRVQALRPGVYRWYVWPVRDGRRDSRATVQAELVVD